MNRERMLGIFQNLLMEMQEAEIINHKHLEDMREHPKDVIKQEAIKRTKFLNTAGFTFDIGFDGKVRRWHKTKEILSTLDYANLGGMIEFINFFNITEEDLLMLELK